MNCADEEEHNTATIRERERERADADADEDEDADADTDDRQHRRKRDLTGKRSAGTFSGSARGEPLRSRALRSPKSSWSPRERRAQASRRPADAPVESAAVEIEPPLDDRRPPRRPRHFFSCIASVFVYD